MNYKKILDALIYKRKVLDPLDKADFEQGQIETHHIIMRSMGGGNESGNLVNLTLREHYLAHELLVYIYRGTDNEITARRAWNGMSRKMGSLVKNSRLYMKLRSAYSKRAGDSTRGKKCYNNGLKNRYFKDGDVIPAGYVLGMLPMSQEMLLRRRQSAHKGYIRVNNGITERSVTPGQIPEGFTKGILPRSGNTGKIRVNNGVEQRFVFPDKVPDGFQPGPLPFSDKHIQALRQAAANMPEETKKAKAEKISKKLKGKSNWAKGTKQSPEHIRKRIEKLKSVKMSEELRRRISEFQKGKIKVNNGIKTIYADPDNIPEGFVPGQLHKKQKK